MTKDEFEYLEIGDIVYFTSPHTPRKVTNIYRNTGQIATHYVSKKNQIYNPCRIASFHELELLDKGEDYIPYDQNKPCQEEKTMAKKLFKVINTEDFGTYLATTANGEIVLEFKDTVKAYSPDKLEEVLPYTVRVRPFGASCGKDYQVSKEVGLQVNDVLLITALTQPDFGIVEAVDTKKMNSPELTFRKVMLE